MVDSQKFGQEIKKMRNKLGFTVRQAALISNISPAYYSQVENGKRGIPKPKTLKKFAMGLKVDQQVLFSLAGIMTLTPTEVDHEIDGLIKHSVNRIDPASKHKVLNEVIPLKIQQNGLEKYGVFPGSVALVKLMQYESVVHSHDILAINLDSQKTTVLAAVKQTQKKVSFNTGTQKKTISVADFSRLVVGRLTKIVHSF